MDLTYIVDGTEVNFSGVSPARLATLPEDSPLCFDDPDDLVKELELNVPLSRFEDVVENYFDHGKFLVPMRRKKDGWLTIIDDSRLESFVELWMRLKLPQDTNFLLSREIVRSQRRDVIVQELAEVRTTLDAIESSMKELRPLVRLVTDEEPDLAAALTGNRALIMSSLRTENYVSEDIPFEHLEQLMRLGPEESRTTVMRKILEDLIGVQTSKTRESSWSEHKKRLKSALRWIPDGEDLPAMLELERNSALIPKLQEWPLLDSSREFLANEMADLEEKLAKLDV
jgi:hypothetical protein